MSTRAPYLNKTMENKVNTKGIKIMGQALETIGQRKERLRKEELKEYQDKEKERIKKSAKHPANKVTANDMWAIFKELEFMMNHLSDRLIRIEMYLENVQEYINKTGKLEILNKSDEYNQPVKKDKK